MTLAVRICLLALLMLAPMQAWTHQQKEAITRVLFNPRTENIEVMHRFLLHDAEHAVRLLRGGEANILASEQDREYFAQYIYQHFTLSGPDGLQLPLQAVGHELEGRFIWVYAETPIPEGLESLTLRHDALLDIWPEQVNLVNLERDGKTRSAAFTATERELTVELAPR